MDSVNEGRPGGADDRLLAWPAVHEVTGLSRTTAWRMQKVGDFPLPVLVSKGRVGWWESELAAWKLARAPRRPPEPRPFEATSRARLPTTVTEPAGNGTAVGRPAGAKAPAKTEGRRDSRTAPGQIAFDFGS